MSSMVLSGGAESLIKVVRMPGPDEARKVLTWAQQLAELNGGRRLACSDPGPTRTCGMFMRESLERFDQEEREGS